MARSSQADPLQRFRFNISVIEIDLSAAGLLTTAAGLTSAPISGLLKVLTRTGFSEITLPKATISTISYRENIDNIRFAKGPGLVKYEPITLKRGVTGNQDLWNWYQLVNNEMLLTNVAMELGANSTKPPAMGAHFRKEVIIQALDREGNNTEGSTKQWMLFNAFPTGYKGGNDFNSQAEENLIEELTLDYEYFVELTGGLGGYIQAVLSSSAQSGINALTNFATPSLPFTRS